MSQEIWTLECVAASHRPSGSEWILGPVRNNHDEHLAIATQEHFATQVDALAALEIKLQSGARITSFVSHGSENRYIVVLDK